MSSNREKLEKLKKLQAARSGKALTDEEEEEDSQLYDEVDEKEYRSRKRQELLQDDFVEDDDGVGYVDHGIDDDWGKREDFYSDEEDVDMNKRKFSGKKTENDKDQKVIESMLRAQQTKLAVFNQFKKTKKSFADDEFDDILGEFDEGTQEKPKIRITSNIEMFSSKLPSSPSAMGSSKRSISSKFLAPSPKKLKTEADSSIDNSLQINSSPLKSHSQKITIEKSDMSDEVKSSPTSSKGLKIKQEESDDESDEDIMFGRRTMRSITATRQINLSSKSNTGSSPFVTAPGTPIGASNATPSKDQKFSSSSAEMLTLTDNKYTKEQIVDPETGYFNMFWLDFTEVDNTLILFGKVKAHDGSFVSAMVQVNGMDRELFFLTRDGHTPEEVHEEIVPLLLEKYGLENIRAKPQAMKYAFELPEIPKKANYLKVLLPFKTPKNTRDLIPPELSSDTFRHVFGGNTNILESFLVQNKIMGPCWLEIKNGDFEALQNTSHCALEISIAKPQYITPIENSTVPILKCTSLSMQTVMNVKENRQEIVSITISNYNSLSLDSPIPEDLKPDDIVTLVRPPNGTNFPLGLAALAKQKLNGQVRLFNNEKTLLACFCAMVKVSDPDVIIGHRLESIFLDVLAHRVHSSKIPTFSSLGRRSRKEWPERFGKNNSNMNHFLIREIFSGRLLCDISNEMGQSLTPKCQSWELPEMYQVTCGREYKPADVNYQSPQYQDDVNMMIMALQANINNSTITAEVSFRIQMLSLTKQLTNLAGNAWAQTLSGTRAGRNEYILLHEFTRNGYIVPDKETNRMRTQKQEKSQGITNGDGPATKVSSKKSKYQGGLVFDPEKGLHKNYVLVMDFNSLYPSIIQEFNICFTSVVRNLNNIEELPEVPSDSGEQGVLPRLLANLVQRRREVKKLMATESDPHKRVQCDIRQQALKLTANSMYGCLGYVNSRFYAKPLAMLVTGKGREILMNTRQLAESMGLLVVYGDTDSVMIDTGCDNYADAIVIGQNFKKLVNERYKLLEIDIDNVFKKLLLHAKKKYAALNVTIDKDKKEHTVLEVKGLDMKRREYCPLSKDVSIHVLNTLLSDTDPETALQEIYEYLEDIKSKVEKNEIRIDKYKINTKLSKDPSAYPGGKTMPAVQVALKMRKAGRVVKAGTVITFVITRQETEDNKEGTEELSPAARAYSLNDVMVKGNKLIPDNGYYLEKQIFAPVERLLDRIESFDVIRLSEALGLDSRKYLQRSTDYSYGNSNSIENLQPLETTISDLERFKDSSNLELQCPSCSKTFPFGGIVASNHYLLSYNGIQCKTCDHIFLPIQVTSQLEKCIRSHISLYYAGWLQCDDRTCGNVTRQISVFGKRCLNDGCTGVIRYRYTDKQLYNQLLYFDSLFDPEKNKKQELKPLYHEGDTDFPKEPLNETSIKALSEQNRDLMELNNSIVQKYLSDCGRRYVDMGSIFEFMTT